METEGESSEQVNRRSHAFCLQNLKSVRPAGLGPLSQCFTNCYFHEYPVNFCYIFGLYLLLSFQYFLKNQLIFYVNKYL